MPQTFVGFVCNTVLTMMWAGKYFSCMPCSLARATITCKHTAKPFWALDSDAYLGQPRHIFFLPYSLTQNTQVLGLYFHVADMAQGKHGHLCPHVVLDFDFLQIHTLLN
jgi:hypothetical protein